VDAEAMLMLAEWRKAQLRAKVEHDWSGRQATALVPTVRARVVAAARALVHGWGEPLGPMRMVDRRCSERSSESSWRQVDGVPRGSWEPWRSLFAQRRPTTVVR